MANSTRRVLLLLLAAIFGAGLGLTAFAQSTTVKPDPPPTVCIGSKCVSAPVTTTSTSTHTIKWHPGQYAASNSITFSGNGNASQKAQEIAMIRAGPSQVLGIQEGYEWNVFEPTTLGVYNFSVLDADYVNTTGYVSGTVCGSAVYNSPRLFGVYIMASDWFSADPTTVLPTYITSSPGTYGSGYDGTHGGYWVSNGSGGIGTEAVAALWRPSVMNRFIALGAALGSHVLPDGCTVDNSPYVEAIWMLEETAQIPDPSTDPTFSSANYIAELLALGAGGKAAFPHTTFSIPNNYAGDAGTSQTIETNLVVNRTAASGPDIFTAADQDMTWGQHAYIGNGWNGSAWIPGAGTNLINVVPYEGMIMGTEMGYEYSSLPSDLFNFSNSTLHATSIWWTILVSNEANYVPGNWYGSAYANPSSWNASTSGGVLATIVNSKLSNTAYPSAYP
jgi:hypothetical protein